MVDMVCYDFIRGEFGFIMCSVVNLKGFKIVSLNVNSLFKYIDEIRYVLCSIFFDIFVINEFKIDELIFDNEISIFGYNFIRKDWNRVGGGVVLYIWDNILFFDREDLVFSSFEMVCVEINCLYSKFFFVCIWYRFLNLDMDLFNECEIFF